MSQETDVLKALLARARTDLSGMADAIKSLDEYDDMVGELESVHDLIDEIDQVLDPDDVEEGE